MRGEPSRRFGPDSRRCDARSPRRLALLNQAGIEPEDLAYRATLSALSTWFKFQTSEPGKVVVESGDAHDSVVELKCRQGVARIARTLNRLRRH